MKGFLFEMMTVFLETDIGNIGTTFKRNECHRIIYLKCLKWQIFIIYSTTIKKIKAKEYYI